MDKDINYSLGYHKVAFHSDP